MYTQITIKIFFTFYKKKFIIIWKKFFQHTIIKFFFPFVYIKVDQNNITSFQNDDRSYTIIDLYLNSRFLGCKDSYNYDDIDVDKILSFKKSDNEYIIRYDDANKMMIVALQLKINNSYNEINAFKKIIKQSVFIMVITNFLEDI